MKKMIMIFSILLFIGCGNNTNDEDIKAQDENKHKNTIYNSCEQFLNDYENWVDEVIIIYKKIKENPTDIKNTKKMMEATQKMSEWSQKWTKLYDCANTEKYSKRMEDIQARVDSEIY